MKSRLSLAAIILVLGLAAPATAGPYEDASDAYVNGRYETALRLWQPLADQGHPGAQYGLGLLYDMGRGVAKSSVMAHMWFDLSAAQSNPSAARSRDTIARHMTSTQITEAQKRAREWHEQRSGQ